MFNANTPGERYAKRHNQSVLSRTVLCVGWVGEAGAVHEGKSGQSLADGWAMIDGYESGLTQYKDKKYESNE